MAEREFERKNKEDYREQDKTSEIWSREDNATTSSDVEKEYEKGKTPRVDSDLATSEFKTTVNPPDGGGKILKNAAGARNHLPGATNNPNFKMETVKKAEEVISKGQERFNVKWPDK